LTVPSGKGGLFSISLNVAAASPPNATYTFITIGGVVTYPSPSQTSSLG
jgi:hypothetical protein